MRGSSSSPPDNTAAFYHWQFQQALQLADARNFPDALDICWEMRLRPNLGHFQRALVNLFIGTFADPHLHDRKRFGQECLNLLQVLRNNGLRGDDSEITRMEEQANELLKILEISELTATEETDDKINSDDETDNDDEKDNDDNNKSGDTKAEWSDVLYSTPNDTIITEWAIEGVYGTLGGSKKTEARRNSAARNLQAQVGPLLTPPTSAATTTK